MAGSFASRSFSLHSGKKKSDLRDLSCSSSTCFDEAIFRVMARQSGLSQGRAREPVSSSLTGFDPAAHPRMKGISGVDIEEDNRKMRRISLLWNLAWGPV